MPFLVRPWEVRIRHRNQKHGKVGKQNLQRNALLERQVWLKERNPTNQEQELQSLERFNQVWV